MTQELSSLMDGELEAHEAERAIGFCCASREAAQTWHAYHLIGEVLRGASPGHTGTAERVRIALAAEPTVLAPRRMAERPIAKIALAAAASLATVAVVGWIGVQGGPAPSAPMVANGAVASAIRPVAAKASVPASAPVVDVQAYLAAHRQIPSPELYRPVVNRAPAGGR